MAKRLFDMVVSAAALIVLSPILLIAAVGILLSSRGPVFYRAQRVGRNCEVFTMHKFRTMHVGESQPESVITGPNDSRVFPWGSLLRLLKIDELPQMYDVLRGKMSLVGPRPEDPGLVREHYTPQHMETLRVLPGLVSPGSIYNYTHGERILAQGDPERVYVESLLPVKLALETVYVRQVSFWYDLQIILRAALVIALVACGKRDFSDPPEMARIWPTLEPTRGRAASQP
jgi:lipopolysaccharide/colanic/teichoic acid biosynthesis glycosyltransferase